MVVSGCVILAVAGAWFRWARHIRGMWSRAGRDVTKAAIMLELEERVSELERSG